MCAYVTVNPVPRYRVKAALAGPHVLGAVRHELPSGGHLLGDEDLDTIDASLIEQAFVDPRQTPISRVN